jgi:hypothetical protein
MTLFSCSIRCAVLVQVDENEELLLWHVNSFGIFSDKGDVNPARTCAITSAAGSCNRPGMGQAASFSSGHFLFSITGD